jgi:hypothetical protein
MRPVCIWITSRSRSSLVSKIFINHGLWWGNTPAYQTWRADGVEHKYLSYENQHIKQLMNRYRRKHWPVVHCNPVHHVDGFIADLADIVPENERWVCKTGVEYYPAFQALDPYNVFVYRDPTTVARSLCEKRPGTDYDDALTAVQWRFDYMARLMGEHGGVVVNTDDIVAGDFEGIRAAVEYCGLAYDQRAAERAIC